MVNGSLMQAMDEKPVPNRRRWTACLRHIEADPGGCPMLALDLSRVPEDLKDCHRRDRRQTARRVSKTPTRIWPGREEARVNI